MTADKDDPRFDEFYLAGNEVRLFMALFLTAMPSYMGLGYEVRDAHYEPAPNEYYTKLYVFQLREGPKATFGPYVWGKNGALFSALTRLRRYADAIWARIKERPTRWLLAPDATAENRVVAWTQTDRPEYVFLANTDLEQPAVRFGLPLLSDLWPAPALRADFSTSHVPVPVDDQTLRCNGKHYRVTLLRPGEGRVYRVNDGLLSA
jgi:hypothetical protein